MSDAGGMPDTKRSTNARKTKGSFLGWRTYDFAVLVLTVGFRTEAQIAETLESFVRKGKI